MSEVFIYVHSSGTKSNNVLGGHRNMWTKSWMRWIYLSRKFRWFHRKWDIFLLPNIWDRRWHAVLGLVNLCGQQVYLIEDDLSSSGNFSKQELCGFARILSAENAQNQYKPRRLTEFFTARHLYQQSILRGYQ